MCVKCKGFLPIKFLPPGAPRLSLIFILDSLIDREHVLVRCPTTRNTTKQGVNIERISPVGPALAKIIPLQLQQLQSYVPSELLDVSAKLPSMIS